MASPILIDHERLQAYADKYIKGRVLHRVSGVRTFDDPKGQDGQPITIESLGGIIIPEAYVLDWEEGIIPLLQNNLNSTINMMSQSWYTSGGKAVEKKARVIVPIGGRLDVRREDPAAF